MRRPFLPAVFLSQSIQSETAHNALLSCAGIPESKLLKLVL
jgi:hypothetical protein